MTHPICIKYIRAFFLTILSVAGMLAGCIDDDLRTDCSADEDDDLAAIAFDIALDAADSDATRADGSFSGPHADELGEDIDNMVDIERNNHDFRVLLFDKDDKFLFEPDFDAQEYTYREIDAYDYDSDNDNTTGIASRRWRIRIPVSVIKANGVLDEIMANDFKIAILANWPKSNSNPLEFDRGESILKLSHYWSDNVYGSSSESNKNAFGFLTDDGKMGATCDWVETAYKDTATARDVIQNGLRLNPHTIDRQLGDESYTYKHIWRVWHFGTKEELAEGNSGVLLPISENKDFVSAWQKKFDECKDVVYGVNKSGFTNYCAFYENDGLDFVNVSSSSYDGGDGKHYLKLAKGLTKNQHNEKTTNIENERLKFTAFAQGQLWITAKSGSSTTQAYLGLQTKENSDNNTDFRKIETLGNEFKTYKFDISVTGTSQSNESLHSPEIISIYAIDATVHIKQIVYMEAQYLQNTDRRGKLPEERQLIPMYGIQKFDAIGRAFRKGFTLNLSTSPDNVNDGYPRKKIYLLRSMAKVELYIPTSWQPSHIYFRCMNRSNRCEPVDPAMPTNEAWNNVDTEIESIRQHGVFYSTKESDKKNYASYRNHLAWFYGAWHDLGWEWNTTEPISYDDSDEVPHIFNSRINRSDYCYFRKTDDIVDGRVRYVLYVPEKSIDDPSTIGNRNATPKIPHIEIRFRNRNEDDNIDDNDCYRIYFQNAPQLSTPTLGFDGKEQTEDFLSKLYPIMRNHIYRFTISSNSDEFETSRSIDVTMDVHPYGSYELEPEFGLRTAD